MKQHFGTLSQFNAVRWAHRQLGSNAPTSVSAASTLLPLVQPQALTAHRHQHWHQHWHRHWPPQQRAPAATGREQARPRLLACHVVVRAAPPAAGTRRLANPSCERLGSARSAWRPRSRAPRALAHRGIGTPALAAQGPQITLIGIRPSTSTLSHLTALYRFERGAR
jgi:hypothetical protein